MKKLAIMVYLVFSLSVSTETVLAADVPHNNSKRSSANLYLTATEAYTFKQRNADHVLFIGLSSLVKTMHFSARL